MSTTRERLELCRRFMEETGLEHHMEYEGGENPFDLLLIPAFQQTPDEEGRPMAMSCYFANAAQAYTDRMQFDLLNFMGYVDHGAAPGALRELRAYLGELNFQLPLGNFGVDEEGTVYLRYTQAVPREMDDENFVRLFGIAMALMNIYSLMFIKPIFEILNGKKTAKTALAGMKDDIDELQGRMQQIGELQ